jgi:TolB protein
VHELHGDRQPALTEEAMRRPTAILILFALLACPVARAQQPPSGPVVIDVRGAKRDLYKIAVPALVGERAIGGMVADVVSFDLSVSGWFKVLDPRSFLARLEAEGLGIVVGDWRNVGAEGVAKGRALTVGDELSLEFKLYEVGRGEKPVLEKAYRGPKSQARGFAHAWANEVVKYFSGEDAFFGSRIAFSAATGPGRKDVFVMDFDGANLHRVTENGSQNILPNWSPSGDRLVFTSFLRGNPDLYVVSAGGGRPKRISDRPGVNMGGAFSPDGGRIAATLSMDGNPEIYLLGPDGAIGRRLTENPFIDASPAWSPDGSQIAFVSNRHGNPQIWTMGADGSNQQKVTRRGNYNQEPSWCPKCQQPTIAFTARDERGAFDCFTVNLATNEVVRLTEGQGSNQHPSWAPNGRALVMASSRGGLWITTADGKVQRQVYKGAADVPVWGPGRK